MRCLKGRRICRDTKSCWCFVLQALYFAACCALRALFWDSWLHFRRPFKLKHAGKNKLLLCSYCGYECLIYRLQTAAKLHARNEAGVGGEAIITCWNGCNPSLDFSVPHLLKVCVLRKLYLFLAYKAIELYAKWITNTYNGENVKCIFLRFLNLFLFVISMLHQVFWCEGTGLLRCMGSSVRSAGVGVRLLQDSDEYF